MESSSNSATSGSAAGQKKQPSAAKATNRSNKEPATATANPPPAPAHFFRPIKFESTPATPESENDSTGGSETTIDSAYGSDVSRSARIQGQQGEGATGGVGAATAAGIVRGEDGEPLGSSGIMVKLQNKNLWKSFNKIGNEMIVTKPGRRLFPALMVTMHGMDPDMDYVLYLKVTPTDDQRYRYINMKWCPTGETEVNQNEELQTYRHPSSPNTGQFWMKRPVSFKSIKITHYPKSKFGNILLHTMHKYTTKLVIEPIAEGAQKHVVCLPDTTFIAVSAYQNVELTQLKIDNNPFAKGFRYKKVPGGGRGSLLALRTSQMAPRVTTERQPNMLAYWQQVQQMQQAQLQQMQQIQQIQGMQGVVSQFNLRMPMGVQQGASSSSQNPDNPPPTPAELPIPMPMPMVNGVRAIQSGTPTLGGASSQAVRPPFQVSQHQGLPQPPPPFPVFYQHHPFMSPPPCQLPPAPSRDMHESVIRGMPAPIGSCFKPAVNDSTDDTETEVEPAETESEEDMEDTEDTEYTEEEGD